MNRKRDTVVSVCLAGFLSGMPALADVGIGTDVITTGTEIKVLEPGPDLQAIIDGIDDELDPVTGVIKPYLIKLGPGYYTITPDVDTGYGLLMAPFISITGSGEGVTVLKGSISSGSRDSSSAVVTGASNAALTDIRVENAGGGRFSIAIYNDGAAPEIKQVAASAYGGTDNYGVLNDGSSSPTMRSVIASAFGGEYSIGVANYNSSSLIMTEVTATANGGTNNYGVLNGGSSLATMTEVNATASGGTNNYGVRNTSSSAPTMTQVTATASGGTNNYGVYNFTTSSLKMTEVSATASGGSLSYGVYNANSDSVPLIERSLLSGGTDAMRFGGSTGTRISNSKLIGGIADNPAGVQCRDAYDENLADVTC